MDLVDTCRNEYGAYLSVGGANGPVMSLISYETDTGEVSEKTGKGREKNDLFLAQKKKPERSSFGGIIFFNFRVNRQKNCGMSPP